MKLCINKLQWALFVLLPSCIFAQSPLYTPFGLVNPVIATNNWVGVGTTNPNYLFEVKAQTAPISYNFDEVAGFTNDRNSVVTIASEGTGGNPRNAVLHFKEMIQQTSWIMGIAGNDQGQFKIANVPIFGLSAGVKLTILQNGHVGIGTETPARKLSVKGNSTSGSVIGEFRNLNNSVLDIVTEGNDGNSIIRFLNNSGDAWSIGNDGSNDAFKIADRISDDFGGGVHFTILQNGNVGIGTKTPQSKLAVDGTICAKEVKVALSGNGCWPDYVFASDYQLQSLESLKIFIEKERHLPGIPSANEIEEDGVELGALNVLLVQKIEELTLYMLAMKEQNDALIKESKELQSRLSALENNK